MSITELPLGIRCPACRSVDMRVLRTQQLPDDTVRRYRRCLRCKNRIVTLERPADRQRPPK